MSRRLKALLGFSVTVLVLAFAVTGSGAPGTSTRLAYIGTDAIYLVNTDGSARELIVRGVADSTTFSWSPDGRRLTFSGGHRRAEEIFVVNIDGSGVKQLTRPPRTRRRTEDDWSEDPSWSPNGKRIVFDGARKETRGVPDIYVMRADGTGCVGSRGRARSSGIRFGRRTGARSCSSNSSATHSRSPS